VTPLPTGVGNSEEQKAFLQEHAAFLVHYPALKTIVEKAVCRRLAPPPQSEVDRLRGRRDDDAEVVAFQNRATTDIVVFFLARIAAEDFSEILILSGNGRGIGAYKILRGMYERVVHAVYLDKNEEASRRFVRQSDVYKYKLAARLLEFGIDLLSDFSPADKADLEKRAKDAKNDKPLLTIPDMAEQAGQNLKAMYGPCHLEPTIHIHANAFGMERRLVRKPGGGVSFNDADYRPQARRALVFGHNLLIHILALQNSRFHLGMEEEVQECVKAFTEIWGQERTDTPQH
jgi:hypothetical protein